MSRRPKFYRDGGRNVVEFEDGVRLYISKDSLTEQDILILEALKTLVTPLSLTIQDVQAKVEEIKKLMAVKATG